MTIGSGSCGRTRLRPILVAALLFGVLASSSFGQRHQVTGVVRDRNTYRAVSNVNVFIKGTKIGTTTDFSGRFRLPSPPKTSGLVVVFRHIAYERLEVPLDSLALLRQVFLQPRVIPLRGVVIEEERARRMEIDQDLPQPVALIESREFEIRGYVDAGDLLRTDQSVQVDEELSGRKVIGIRGGNPDEVVVLYNGIKMNNVFDNIFDFSLIDLEDISRLELIKGSNTALYGPEAFAGVINIVPRVEKDYHLRFQQRLGTYRSGNWGLHLFEKMGGVTAGYNLERGGARREFLDAPGAGNGLENSSTHHNANLRFEFSRDAEGRPASLVDLTWFRSSLHYTNRRDKESVQDLSQLFSGVYTSRRGVLRGLSVSLSRRTIEETQSLALGGSRSRDLRDRTLYLDVKKPVRHGPADLVLAYQLRLSRLDLRDQIGGSSTPGAVAELSQFERRHHGLVAIFKLNDSMDSPFLQRVTVGVSFRYDRVTDESRTPGGGERTPGVVIRAPTLPQEGQRLVTAEKVWQETMAKFSFDLRGYHRGIYMRSYLTFGANVKFPTLLQEVSTPLTTGPAEFRPNLSPEKNSSVEIGVSVTREMRQRPAVYGWQLSGSFFQNHYDNKFRALILPGVPLVFYDNVQTARISGFEARPALFLFRKKITLELGLSRYFISEKAAFPFKSETKYTSTLSVDHAGYSFQLFWFAEGEQVGWLRQSSGGFAQVTLPAFSNLDVHFSKTFEFKGAKLFLNASARNLLHGKGMALQGLAIRDRRYYLTFGAQY